MGLPDFNKAAGASVVPAASPSPPAPTPTLPSALDDDASTPYEPSVHRFPFDLGDGFRGRIPEDVVPAGLIAEEDRVFEIRQLTIAENCRAVRLAIIGEQFELGQFVQRAIKSAVRKVGQKTGAALGDQELDRWIGILGIHGFALVKSLYDDLVEVRPHEAKAFEASKRDDMVARKFRRRLSASTVPRKRWAARVGLPGLRWEMELDCSGVVLGGRWRIGDAVAEEAQAALASRDLSFTMKELGVAESMSTADMVEDQEDRQAQRVMSTMQAVVEIGGEAIGNSSEDLARKLQWMEDIGPRARQQVIGLYSRLHEVDRVSLARFRETSEPLE